MDFNNPLIFDTQNIKLKKLSFEMQMNVAPLVTQRPYFRPTKGSKLFLEKVNIKIPVLKVILRGP